MALIEHGAGEVVEAARAGRAFRFAEGRELPGEGVVARAGERRARPLEMGLGQTARGPLHAWRHLAHRLGQEDMEVARRRAFAGQPRLGAGQRAEGAEERTDAEQQQRGRDGLWVAARLVAAKEAEGGPQAAQRHTRLVDADRAAAFQHDGAIFLEIGVALDHDLSQGRIWWGIGGDQAGHGGPNRSRRRRPGNRKERQSDEGFVAIAGQTTGARAAPQP